MLFDRPSEAVLGYRALGQNYRTGSGLQRFEMEHGAARPDARPDDAVLTRGARRAPKRTVKPARRAAHRTCFSYR
jgi:hypothetical protein